MDTAFLDRVWPEWEAHYSRIGVDPARICRDGIVDAERYSRAPRKILFILKEVNDWKGGDLRPWLRQGPRYQIWHTVARWAAGILRNFPRFNEVDNYASMQEGLRQVAALNLKKSSGGSQSDMSVINAYAFQDRTLLLKQIQAIGAEMLVACGTFDSLVWLLELKVDPDCPAEKPVFDSVRKAWVVPFRHPGRVDNAKTYAELKQLLAHVPEVGR